MVEMRDTSFAEPERYILSEWISRQELGEQLGVATDTLARWESRRTGPPCIRIGRIVYYRREAVRAWLREQEPARPATGGRR